MKTHLRMNSISHVLLYSVHATGLTTQQSRHRLYIKPEARPASYGMRNGVPSPAVKRPGIATDHSFPSNAGINDEWSHTFTPHVPSRFTYRQFNYTSYASESSPIIRPLQRLSGCSFSGPCVSSSPAVFFTNIIVKLFIQKTVFVL